MLASRSSRLGRAISGIDAKYASGIMGIGFCWKGKEEEGVASGGGKGLVLLWGEGGSSVAFPQVATSCLYVVVSRGLQETLENWDRLKFLRM